MIKLCKKNSHVNGCFATMGKLSDCLSNGFSHVKKELEIVVYIYWMI